MRFKVEPEEILKTIGIYSPEDIDLDLIAYTLGATVKRTTLVDCEGYIVGTEEKAIISINENVSTERQKFSLGHELGHWTNDRRQNLTYKCTTTDMRQRIAREGNFKQQKEVRANQFSAELIIPKHIAQPNLNGLDISFETIRYLANLFTVSLTSTSIRLVDLSDSPCMLVCWDKNGNRKWFTRSTPVPEYILPHNHLLNHRTLLVSGAAEEVDADTWIDGDSAHNFTLIQSVFSNSYDILVLL